MEEGTRRNMCRLALASEEAQACVVRSSSPRLRRGSGLQPSFYRLAAASEEAQACVVLSSSPRLRGDSGLRRPVVPVVLHGTDLTWLALVAYMTRLCEHLPARC